ncbi:hypothetical protein K461DRAFT_57976 [Myriangium duriaei CBS 260.36]|uniref:Extracellular membrane protein CFEM domain-containing protein n=1 Tax=Myriangium duriaei CBS 260.36 TaxID=1168546 RepID=A0A9P4IUU9_9PEZI|nr:hypothetical protein K461DRAFT_57976 [Myriangium duriaei CBS 260.36]
MVSALRAIFVASLALPSTLAVSLADFAPRASNLPSSCEAVYTATIPGCQASDFQNSKCSTGCINALNGLTSSVTKACSGVTGGNIIAAVMVGKATGLLCPNAASYGSLTTTTAAATSQSQATSSQAATSTTKSSAQSATTSTDSNTASSSSSDSSSQSTTIVWATNTVIPQASSVGSSIIYDTSTPASVASATKSHSSDSSETSISQGGSPFSAQPGMGAGSTLKVSSILLTAAVGGAALILVGSS